MRLVFILIFSIFWAGPAIGAESELDNENIVFSPESVEIVLESTDRPAFNVHSVFFLGPHGFKKFLCKAWSKEGMENHVEAIESKIEEALERKMLVVLRKLGNCISKVEIARNYINSISTAE